DLRGEMSAGARAQRPSPAVRPPTGADGSGPDDWTAPGAYQVGDGIWRLPLPLPHDGLRAVNVYVIEADHGLVAVDGGWAVAEARRALEAGLRAIGYTVREIRRFVVTHLHRDHYSQAVAIRTELGPTVGRGRGGGQAPPHLPLRDYLDSLRRVRAMPDLRLLPAHGPPAPSVHRRVDELLRHHDQRLQACLDAVAPTGSTGYEVARRLPWTRRRRAFDSLDALNQMLAVGETVAHLDLLVHQGRLARAEHAGRRVYHR